MSEKTQTSLSSSQRSTTNATTTTTTTTTTAAAGGASDRLSYKSYKDNNAPTSYDIWTSCIFRESDIIPFVPATPDIDPTEVINSALSKFDNFTIDGDDSNNNSSSSKDKDSNTTPAETDDDKDKGSKAAQDAAAAAAVATLRKPLTDAQRKALKEVLKAESRTELIQGEKVPIYLVIAPRGHLDLVNNQELARSHFKSLLISVRLCFNKANTTAAAWTGAGSADSSSSAPLPPHSINSAAAAAAAAAVLNGANKKSKKKNNNANDMSAVSTMLGYTYSGPPSSPLFMLSGNSNSNNSNSNLNASINNNLSSQTINSGLSTDAFATQTSLSSSMSTSISMSDAQPSVMDTMSASTSTYIFTDDDGERVFQKIIGASGVTIMDRGHGIVVIPLELPVCVKSKYTASSDLALCIQMTASPSFMSKTSAEMYELVDPRKQSFGSAAMETKRVLLPVTVLTPLRIEKVRHHPSYTSRIVCFSATNLHKTLPITISRASFQVLGPGGAPADSHVTVFGLADFPVVLGPRDVYQFAAKIDTVPALLPDSPDEMQSGDAQAWSLLEWSIPCTRGYLASRHDLSTVALPKFRDFFISLTVPPFVRPQEVFEIEISVTNKTLFNKNISLNLFADTEQQVQVQAQSQSQQRGDMSSLSQTSVIAYPPLRCLRRVVDVGVIPVLRAKTVCIPCVCSSEGTYSLNPIIIVDKTDPNAPPARYLVKETCSVFCSDLNHDDVERVPTEKDVDLEEEEVGEDNDSDEEEIIIKNDNVEKEKEVEEDKEKEVKDEKEKEKEDKEVVAESNNNNTNEKEKEVRDVIEDKEDKEVIEESNNNNNNMNDSKTENQIQPEEENQQQ